MTTIIKFIIFNNEFRRNKKTIMIKKLFSFWILILVGSSSNFLPRSDSLLETNYNHTLANKFWNLCMASYCAPKRIAEWNIGYVSALYPKVTDITVILNNTGNNCGFTA